MIIMKVWYYYAFNKVLLFFSSFIKLLICMLLHICASRSMGIAWIYLLLQRHRCVNSTITVTVQLNALHMVIL